MKYGCHNRAPFEPSMRVADGWSTSWARNMVDMEFRMSLACQYRDTDLGKADLKCSGCRWRTDDAERAPETPAVADGTPIHGGVQGPLLEQSAGDSPRPGDGGTAKPADSGDAKARAEAIWPGMKAYQPTQE